MHAQVTKALTVTETLLPQRSFHVNMATKSVNGLRLLLLWWDISGRSRATVVLWTPFSGVLSNRAILRDCVLTARGMFLHFNIVLLGSTTSTNRPLGDLVYTYRLKSRPTPHTRLRPFPSCRTPCLHAYNMRPIFVCSLPRETIIWNLGQSR